MQIALPPSRRAYFFALVAIVLVPLVGCSKHSAGADDQEQYEEWLNYPDCSWGPDSNVYFTYIGDTVGNAKGMYRIPITGQGSPEYVGPYDGGPRFPSTRVSPCGDRLAYVYVYYPGRAVIWLKDLTAPTVVDGKATLVRGDAFLDQVSWLGCDTILYNTESQDTWMLDLNNGEDTTLYPWAFSFISASRDGKTIAFTTGDYRHIATIRERHVDTIITLQAAEGDWSEWILDVRVSPDGRRIAYDHSTGPTPGNRWGMHVDVIDAKTGALTSSIDLARNPAWTADGRLVYVSLVEHKLYQLWIQDRNGNRRMFVSRYQFSGVEH